MILKQVAILGACPRMHFTQTLRYFQNNNARNIRYMAVLIFLENLDFEQNAYSRTSSYRTNVVIDFYIYSSS